MFGQAKEYGDVVFTLLQHIDQSRWKPQLASLSCGVKMASISLLVINDHTVAPHLELLRRVCDPKSTSKPHITVRYFNKLGVPQDHFATVIRYIDLLKPGAFNSKDSHGRAVFIQCDADELVTLEHKPHFPESESHITLYQGGNVEFAESLLDTLQQFQWMFRLQLPGNTTLSHVQLKRPRMHRVKARSKLRGAPNETIFRPDKRTTHVAANRWTDKCGKDTHRA